MIGIMGSSHSKKANSQSGLAFVYVAFVIVALAVYHWLAEGEFSAVLTLSAIFQCLAFTLLGVHAFTTGSVKSISAKSLQLEALALGCRLSSTVWLEGYLPNDSTGDYLYQCFDALSFALVLGLLYRVLKTQDRTYEADDDSMPVMPFAVGCLVLATLFHGDLNDNPLFDTLWMCGLFIGAVAVLPQLWLITRRRGSTPALASHFIAAMAVARMLSGTYMWHAAPEITCEPWFKDWQHAGFFILSAHAVHLILLADFAYFYVKGLATSGLQLELPLHGSISV